MQVIKLFIELEISFNCKPKIHINEQSILFYSPSNTLCLSNESDKMFLASYFPWYARAYLKFLQTSKIEFFV